MAELKLFISHSSRLDDVEGAQDSEENWSLLQGICNKIREQELGVEINVLVDQYIGAGKDWEKHLNLWLAECHAAIILYSKRALEQSDWVKKEATILNWRWQVEKNFPLLPVFFEDETGIEDTSDSFWKTIGLPQINSTTCKKDPAEIVRKISQLDNFKKLVSEAKKSARIFSPFSDLAEDLTLQLNDPRILNDLMTAWNRLTHPEKPMEEVKSIDDIVHNLIRFQLTSPEHSIEKLHLFTDQISRKEPRQRIQEVYATVRGFWVDAGAAAWLPAKCRRGTVLALNGNHLDQPASTGTGSTKNFTIDRYINKVWQNKKGIFVPVTDKTAKDEIERQIWEEYGHYLDLLDDAPKEEKDEIIRQFRNEVNQKEFIVVYFPLKDHATGIPDPDRINELKSLTQTYPKLRILIGTGREPLSDEIPGLSQIDPILDTDLERTQYIKDGPLNKLLCQ